MEREVRLQLPQASENFVYAPNPESGTVAVIDAKTQAIRSLDTGDRPTYLKTLPGTDDAIVLNIGSNRQAALRPRATIIRTRDDGSTTTDLEVVSGANTIEVAPDGKHAIVYFDSAAIGANVGSGSFQDVSVLVLSEDGQSDQVINMTVGFRPRSISFASDSRRAQIVTEDGVSVLDFEQIEREGSGIARLVTFGSVDVKALDVVITPDGRFALARAENESVLRLVALSGEESVRTLDLAQFHVAPPDGADAGVDERFEVTDLDLMPDGSAALAVLRSQGLLLTLPLPGAFEDASSVSSLALDGVIGSVSVSGDGKYGLLYTTAANIEQVTVVELGTTKPPRIVLLRKGVEAVIFTADDKNVLITHSKAEGDPDERGISPDLALDRAYGYSMLRLETGDVKLQSTSTELGPVAMVPDGSFLFILFRNDSLELREIHRVSLASFLVDPILQLENPPVSVGIAPASHSVFINLEHPDGRMTFLDWQDPSQLKTVTGFELNSRIRN